MDNAQRFLLIISLFNCQSLITGKNQLFCLDWTGKRVHNGKTYVPDKRDPCKTCNCDRGHPVMCATVSCSPQCNGGFYRQVEGKCCEFVCLKDSPSHPPSPNSTDTQGKDDESNNVTVLGLRLVASSVTSLLILSLLIFMIHRLRQRRLLLHRERFRNTHRRLDEVDGNDFMPDPHSIAIQIPPYEDPPPPYSPPKPNHIIEPPPPYESVNRNDNAALTGDDGSTINESNNLPDPDQQSAMDDTQLESSSTSFETCSDNSVGYSTSSVSHYLADSPSEVLRIVTSSPVELNASAGNGKSDDECGNQGNRGILNNDPSPINEHPSNDRCRKNRSKLRKSLPDFESKVISGLKKNKGTDTCNRRQSGTERDITNDRIVANDRSHLKLDLDQSLDYGVDKLAGSLSDHSPDKCNGPKSPSWVQDSPIQSGSSRGSICSETGERKMSCSATGMIDLPLPGAASPAENAQEGTRKIITDGNPVNMSDRIAVCQNANLINGNVTGIGPNFTPDFKKSNSKKLTNMEMSDKDLPSVNNFSQFAKDPLQYTNGTKVSMKSPKRRMPKNRVILSYISPTLPNPKTDNDKNGPQLTKLHCDQHNV